MKVTIQDSRTSVTVEPRDFRVTVSGARGPAGPSEWGGIDGDIEDQTDLYNALQARVPYTGATADVNLGEYGAQLGNLEFDNTPTNVPTAAGSVYWNDTDGTLNMVLKGGQTISRIGETQHIRALNNTGAQIARGKVVYVVGAQGQRLTIALADADTEILSKDTIGFTSESIADGAEGFVIVQGVVNNISTTGMTDGATVYLSQTAGSYTTTPPADPAHLVILGFIVNGGSGGAGSIYVKVDNGYELEELHNVSNSAKTTPVADDALFLRDSADNNLWKRLTWTNALAGVKTHMDTFKSVSGGYASLDGSGKVPSNELPSYVDDVVEVANYAALPVTGETGKIYVTIDTNKCYRWSGSAYIQVAQGVDTLTTTGTSGAATLVGSTLNIPQYQSVLTNPVTGTGTAGQVSYWSGTGTQTGSADFTWNDTTKILSFSNGGALINEIRVGSINTNTIIGRLAGSSPSLTGANNSFFGQSAGRNNSTGNQNSIFGSSAGLNNTTGANNSFFGREAGRNNTTGGSNSFFGLSAGQYIANGSNLTVANNSVFLGFDTRAAADSQTNQTVIGYQAIGLGSNTTVIGNSSTTLTWLGGSTSIGTTDSSARLHVRGSGPTSSTTALLVQNSTPSELLRIYDDGNITIGSVGSSIAKLQVQGTGLFETSIRLGTAENRIYSTDNTGAFITAGQLMRLRFAGNTAIGYGLSITCFNNNTTVNASGENGTLLLSHGYAPTSGTGTFRMLQLEGTINQTGGANGITRGLYVNPTLTAAADWRSVEFSNNTGWGLYGPGAASNYINGTLGIGTTTVNGYSLHVAKTMTGAVTTFGVMSDGIVQSDSTNSARYFMTLAGTQAASFTVGNIFHYIASQSTFGLNSVVTAQYGFYAASQLTGATNNYGFYGDIASGTGRWNLYMNGTAANYIAGNTSIGTTTSSGRLTVQGSGTTSSTKALVVNNSTPTAIFEILDNGRINQTIPGGSTNTLFGTDAGANASLANNNHTAFGRQALFSTTTAANCTAIGREAAYNGDIGDTTAVGYRALYANISGFGNTAIGTAALASVTSGNNVGVGRNAGSSLTASTNNLILGYNAGRFIIDGVTALTVANNSVFLGFDTRAAADSQSNQIVIGYQAIGNGSNTATLGNTSITNTYLRGNINYTEGGNFVIGTTTGTKIGTATSQKIGFWNATPIIQPTTAVAAATRVGGGGTTVTDSDTFDGYTIAQLVKALRNMGALA